MSTQGRKTSAPTDLELMLYADGELPADRLAAIEEHLRRDEAARRKLAALGLASHLVREGADQHEGPADGIADAVMARIEAEERAPAKVVPLPARPAVKKPPKGSPRTAFTVAGLAAAAAAAVLVWGQSTADRGAHGTPPAPDTVHALQTAAPSAHAPLEANRDEGDAHGVEVAAVDFGAQMGAIFYVRTTAAASSPTTAVVWLSDDAAGGDQ